jgi:hypothetical protein
MDPLDLLGLAYLPMGGRDAPDSPAEAVAYALAALVLPLTLAALILFAGLWLHPEATLALATGFVVLSGLVARLLRVGTAAALRTIVACAISCFVWGGGAFLLAIFLGVFSAF